MRDSDCDSSERYGSNMKVAVIEKTNKGGLQGALLETGFASMSSSFGELKDFLTENFETITKRFDSIDLKMEKVEENIRKDIGDLQGQLFERAIRQDVQVCHGARFGEGFVILGLTGLLRLVLPTKRMSDPFSSGDPGHSISHLGNMSEHQDFKNKLEYLVDFLHRPNDDVRDAFTIVRDLFGEVVERISAEYGFGSMSPNIRDELSAVSLISPSSRDLARKSIFESILHSAVVLKPEHVSQEDWKKENPYHNVWRKLCQYALATRSEQQIMTTDDCGMGILLFAAKVFPRFFPKISIEFDCRGAVERFGEISIIKVGEINSSLQQWQKAVDQLHFRTTILKSALLCVLNGKVLKGIDKGKKRYVTPPGMSVEFM